MTPVTRVRYHWKEEKLLFINNLHIYFEYKGLWNVNPLKLDYLFFDTHCIYNNVRGPRVGSDTEEIDDKVQGDAFFSPTMIFNTKFSTQARVFFRVYRTYES